MLQYWLLIRIYLVRVTERDEENVLGFGELCKGGDSVVGDIEDKGGRTGKEERDDNT